MKKAYIIGSIVLVAALIGIGLLYQFYIKKVIEDYQDRRATRQQIEKRLKDLQTTFYNTKPDVIIQTWREETQPWVDAVVERSEFFNLGDLPDAVKVPEERIPKFYYREVFPKIKEEIDDYVFEKQVAVPPGLFFGAPSELELTGTSPTGEEVEKWLDDYIYGTHLIRFVVDAGPTQVMDIAQWPNNVVPLGQIGDLEVRTTGYDMSMTLPSLVSFLEELRTSKRYFSVESIMITNGNLRDTEAELKVKMVLSEAVFKEKQKGVSATSDVEEVSAQIYQSQPLMRSKLKSLFEKGGKLEGFDAQPSWWENFRKRWIPF